MRRSFPSRCCVLAGAIALALPALAAEPAPPQPAYQALRAPSDPDDALKPKMALPIPAPKQHDMHATIGPDGRLEVVCDEADSPRRLRWERERRPSTEAE